MNAFIKSKIKAKVKPLMPESAYNYFVKWFDDFQVVAAPGVRFYKGVKFTPLLEAAFDEIAFQEEGDEIVYKACTDPKKLKIIKVPSPDGWITFKRVEDDRPRTCINCGNANALWCDRWDGPKQESQTCDEWSKTHWCTIQEDK